MKSTNRRLAANDRLQLDLIGEAAMVAFGQRLGEACSGDATVFLNGNLGMGKTTLCRGVLQAYGHSGAVKSPTYTLVEPYELDSALIYHFDLYRLGDPEELEYLGIRDYFSSPAVRLIEWPERGAGILPQADLLLSIDSLVIDPQNSGRVLDLEAYSDTGRAIIEALMAESIT